MDKYEILMGIFVLFLIISTAILFADRVDEAIADIDNNPTPIKACDTEYGEDNWTIQCTDWANVDWDKVNHNLYWSNNSHDYRCVLK